MHIPLFSRHIVAAQNKEPALWATTVSWTTRTMTSPNPNQLHKQEPIYFTNCWKLYNEKSLKNPIHYFKQKLNQSNVKVWS